MELNMLLHKSAHKKVSMIIPVSIVEIDFQILLIASLHKQFWFKQFNKLIMGALINLDRYLFLSIFDKIADIKLFLVLISHVSFKGIFAPSNTIQTTNRSKGTNTTVSFSSKS